MSWNFLCADMFPCEDSKTVSVCLSVRLSVCPYPEKINHSSFVNISPTLVIDTSMERSSRVLHHGKFLETKKFDFFFKKVWNWIRLVFWLVLRSLNQHSSRSQHAPICRHRGCIVVPLRVDIYYLLVEVQIKPIEKVEGAC